MALSVLMEPWIKPLRKLRATSEGAVLWVDFRDAPITIETVVSVLEGVELLAWLARVSAESFQGVVHQVWPSLDALLGSQRVGIWLHNGHFGSIALRFGCFSFSAHAETLHGLTEVIPSPSNEYSTARAAIKQACEERATERNGWTQSPEIPARVYFDGWRDWHFPVQFNLVVDATRTQAAMRASGTAHDETQWNVRIVTIELGSRTQPLTCGAHLAVLNELRSYGIKVGSCGQPYIDLTVPKSMQAEHFSALQKLLGTHEQARDASVVYAKMATLWLHSDGDTKDMVQRLFAAVAATQSVRRVNFHASVFPHVQAMKAAAVALFSSAAQHDVEHVSIRLHTPESFHALQELFTVTEDPLVVVFPKQAASIHAHQHLEATASRFALFDPTIYGGDADWEDAVVDTYGHKGLRILGHENGWWRVVLPAWGQAWVHESNAVVTTASRSPVQPMGNRTVRKIELNCVGSTLVGTEQLVLNMNPSVERLKLCVDDPLAPADGWSRMLTSLSSLRQMRLAIVRSDQLESIVDSLALPTVAPLLARLQLKVMYEVDTFPIRFFDAIADPTHHLYQCLERLDLTMRTHVPSNSAQGLTTQLARVLDHNTRLISLHIKVNATTSIDHDQLKHVLEPRAGEILSDAPSSIELHQKVAFLSVLRSTSDSTIGDCDFTRHLDSEVVSIIFQYAAGWCRRNITVRTSRLH